MPLELFSPKKYDLENINQALNDLEQRKITRAIIVIDKELENE